MSRLYLNPKNVEPRLPVRPFEASLPRSRTCRRGHLVVEGTRSAYRLQTGSLVCAECQRLRQQAYRQNRVLPRINMHEANPWAGRLACPDCGSMRFTLPYQPGDPRWRCVACHIWIRVEP